MKNVRCDKIETLIVEFEKRLDCNEDAKSVSVQLKADYGENTNPEEKDARLILELIISEKESNDPIYCKLRVAGYFVWDIISSEEAKEIIKQEGAEIIFSFMRTYLYNLMQNAGMSPFILPIEHFESMLEETE